MTAITVQSNASGAGTLTIAAPNTASNFTMTLPAATDTFVGKATTDTLTNKTLTSPTINSPTINTPTMGGTVITSGTAVASTSGTSIDFTGIPSWVKRITVMLSGVSTNGTSNYIIQLGDSGGIETTGYVGASSISGNTVAGQAANYSSGFLFNASSAAFVGQGMFVFTLLGSNIWVGQGLLGSSVAPNTIQSAGTKTLSDTLTQVRITTVNGTDTFDAGTINILYE